ncbi:MAG: DedA family protein [Chloroflexota bacterium]|nr:DedA family protein [Chloroflexota bacterium]MDQ5864918.1 DedA family protein [Chloroflexota bacterium]
MDIFRQIEDAYIWPFVQGIYDSLGWLGVVFLMALESAAIPLPSGVIMPLAGQRLAGTAGNWWGIFLAGNCGAIGSTLGSLLAYWVGARLIRPLLERQGRGALPTRSQLRIIDSWFAKFGPATVFVARLVPIVRSFISLPAGVSRMDLRKFAVYTYLGSFLWSAGLAWAGTIWEPREVRETIRPFDLPILLILLALVVWLLIHNRGNRDKRSATTA